MMRISQMFRYFSTCSTTRTSITSSNSFSSILASFFSIMLADVGRDLVVTA